MKKIIFAVAVTVGFVIALHAATLSLTITITAKEATALNKAVAYENSIRTNLVPPLPAFSQAEFAEFHLRKVVKYFTDKATDEDRTSLIQRYESATPTKQAAADAALQ